MNRPKEMNTKKSSTSTTRQNIQGNKLKSATSKNALQNQNKNTNVKKILVRNTEKPVPETRITKSYLADSQSERSDNKSVQVPEAKNLVKSFDAPELYSTLDISKKMETVVNYRKTKSCSDADNKKFAADEKVSRQVNFPYNQPIYKDLIPLMCDKVQTPLFTATRNPLPQKDREIVLSDFIKQREIPNFYSLPSVEVEDKLLPSCNNNLRLYNILQINLNSEDH